jgi:hypothetical protein
MASAPCPQQTQFVTTGCSHAGRCCTAIDRAIGTFDPCSALRARIGWRARVGGW